MGNNGRNKDAGKRADAGQAEDMNVSRRGRENRQLRMERDILAKAAAWFAGRGEKTSTPSSS